MSSFLGTLQDTQIESPDESGIDKNDTQLKKALSFLKDTIVKKETSKKAG